MNEDDSLIESLLKFELEYMTQNYSSYFDYSSDYANFILNWEVHSPNYGIIKGFHTIFGILLNATKGFILQKSPELEKQEICHVQVGSLIENDKAHDFNKNQLCTAAISLKLKNLHPSLPISFRFEIAPRNLEKDDTSKQETITPNFTWCGITNRIIKNLMPKEIREIKLKACFTKYGIYDINRFKFSFYKSGETGEYVSPEEQVDGKRVIKTEHPLLNDQLYVNVHS